MLKHGRFMQNLEVVPVFPQIIKEEDEEEVMGSDVGSED